MELVKEIVDPWQRVIILNGDFIQFSVVDTQSLATIFLIC